MTPEGVNRLVAGPAVTIAGPAAGETLETPRVRLTTGAVTNDFTSDLPVDPQQFEPIGMVAAEWSDLESRL